MNHAENDSANKKMVSPQREWRHLFSERPHRDLWEDKAAGMFKTSRLTFRWERKLALCF